MLSKSEDIEKASHHAVHRLTTLEISEN